PPVVADAGDRGGQRAGRRAEVGAALVVLEPGDPAAAQLRGDVRDDLADRAGLPAAAADVQDADAGQRVVRVVAEALADDLVARADREHRCAGLRGALQ